MPTKTGSPTAYSLICSAGSYSLSGQNSTLTRGFTLTCSAGSYSLTGQTSALTYTPAGSGVARTLVCSAGAYYYNDTGYIDPDYIDDYYASNVTLNYNRSSNLAYWNGSAWIMASNQLKHWNGTTWI